jgi:hypothetical protein
MCRDTSKPCRAWSSAPTTFYHVVSGVTYLPADSVRMTLAGYYKRYRDYPVSTVRMQRTFGSQRPFVLFAGVQNVTALVRQGRSLIG